jgi:transcriptional regulator with XRE-family HTH domain
MDEQRYSGMAFGIRLQIARAYAGMSIKQVARRLKTTERKYQQVELGRFSVDYRTLERLALIYQYDLDILTGEAYQ